MSAFCSDLHCYLHAARAPHFRCIVLDGSPHALDYNRVHIGTNYFSLPVGADVFAFEIWFAERILLTFVGHQGKEVWKTMLREMNWERVGNHFIVCGYGQVGRTVVEQLNPAHIPYVLIETNQACSGNYSRRAW